MRTMAKIFIGLTGILHILFFKMESLDFMKPEVFERFGLTLEGASYVRIWAFNQGFYNLFLALGLFYALYLISTNRRVRGEAISYFILCTVIGAGTVLALSTPDKMLAGCIQAFPALLGMIFLRLSSEKSV